MCVHEFLCPLFRLLVCCFLTLCITFNVNMALHRRHLNACMMQVSAKKGAFDWKDPEPSVRITYSGAEGSQAVAGITMSIYFCQDGDVCLLDTAVVQIPITCTEFPGQTSTANSSVVYNVRKPSSGTNKLAL